MTATIPDSHKDLLEGSLCVVLTTLMPDGQPQSTVVCCSYDGTHVLVNTGRGYQKEKNMRLNPKVTLLALDPQSSLRWLEVRGEVEMTEEGALEHLNQVTQLYTGKATYYGEVMPAELQEKETRIICKIKPKKVNAFWDK